MARHGKRYLAAAQLIDRSKRYGIAEAVQLLLSAPQAKFDETVELHLKLSVDPSHQDQQVRGTVVLPHGSGKSVRVIAFATGDAAQAAREAGADVVGAEDLVKRIQGGWLGFDAAVASPDVMRLIAPLGRVLGPRGLMPNAKAGTITEDVGRGVRELKAGKVEYRIDRLANVHVAVGKVSMGAGKLAANAGVLIDAIMRAKPEKAKGQFVRGLAVTTTMGPSVRLDIGAAQREAATLAA
ncbi:MAG: 50S ribosomal protein L1 [Actinobacteria bacterium]|nr:50S ribosomal protein L1 [Actinomycetota bacterium]